MSSSDSEDTPPPPLESRREFIENERKSAYAIRASQLLQQKEARASQIYQQNRASRTQQIEREELMNKLAEMEEEYQTVSRESAELKLHLEDQKQQMTDQDTELHATLRGLLKLKDELGGAKLELRHAVTEAEAQKNASMQDSAGDPQETQGPLQALHLKLLRETKSQAAKVEGLATDLRNRGEDGRSKMAVKKLCD